jgi:hypothetical protein
MMLPSQAFLIIGLLLTSAEAWADRDTLLPGDGNGTVQRTPARPQLPSMAAQTSTGMEHMRSTITTGNHSVVRPPRTRNPGPDNIRSAQGKGPVDVLSLSLGGALSCFFVLAFVRRRKTAKVKVGRLPQARLLATGDPIPPHRSADVD